MSEEVCDISEGWDLHLVTFLLQIVREQSVSGCEMQLGNASWEQSGAVSGASCVAIVR